MPPAGSIHDRGYNLWPEVVAGISEQVRERVGPKQDLFVPSFSTTGPAERVAAEVVLFGAVERYFRDRLTFSVCGIPSITLEGTSADWQQIADRIDGFADLGLEWWLGPLRVVLREFASAASGYVDRAFWSSIYRGCGPDGPCKPDDSSPGWFALLFPYLTNREGTPTRRNPWLAGQRTLDELIGSTAAHAARVTHASDPGGSVLRDTDFPAGLVHVPLRWIERDSVGAVRSRRDMELVAGFVGVRQQGQSLRLRPEIGWAIRERLEPQDRPRRL